MKALGLNEMDDWSHQDHMDDMRADAEMDANAGPSARVEMEAYDQSTGHIDTDTSVMCRVQIGVEVGESEFQFNRRNKIESFTMEPNELWFINVGWNHRVVNHSSDKPRIVIISGVLHENLESL